MELKDTIDNMTADNLDVLARAIGGIGPDYDYGLAAKLTPNSRDHLSDIGKLPWHPTFSDESAYSRKGAEHYAKTAKEFADAQKLPEGGHWTGNNYRPSIQMVRDGRTKGLAAYMAQVEPDSKLLTPIPMSKKYFQGKVR